MAIRFEGKVLSCVINNAVNIYYSNFRLNRRLGSGEKYFVEARVANVSGTAPTLSVRLETSADGSNWAVRSTPIVAAPIQSGTVLTGSELGTSFIGGEYARFGVQLGGTGPNAYVELVVVARDTPATSVLDLSSGGTFTRALAAFYFTGAPTNGISAFMVQAASNVRRIENRGDGLGPGLLMEKLATNLILQNRNPTLIGPWAAGSATTTTGDENGPDGSATGTRIQVASGGFSTFQGVTTSNTQYTGSIWHKRKRGTGSGASQASLPNNAVTVGTGASISTTLTETWQRDSASTNIGATTGAVQELEGRAGTGFTAQALDNIVDLPQVELGYYPTSPIVTAGATVTRPADVLSYASGSYPTNFLTTGFSLTFAPDASSTDFINSNEDWRLVQVGSADYLRIRKNTNCVVELVCGSAVVASLTVTFSRAQALTIRAIPSAGSLTVAGATTGNGTNVGTGAAWASGSTLYVGGDNASGNNATGRYIGGAIAAL